PQPRRNTYFSCQTCRPQPANSQNETATAAADVTPVLTRLEHNQRMSDSARALRESDLNELGKRIRERRLACGLTQGQVAGEDISIAYVSRIEAGTRRPDLAV